MIRCIQRLETRMVNGNWELSNEERLLRIDLFFSRGDPILARKIFPTVALTSNRRSCSRLQRSRYCEGTTSTDVIGVLFPEESSLVRRDSRPVEY